MAKKITIKNQDVFSSARTALFCKMCKNVNGPWFITNNGTRYCVTIVNGQYELTTDGQADLDVIAAIIDVTTGNAITLNGVTYKYKSKKIFWTKKRKAVVATTVCVVGAAIVSYYANKE